MDTGKTELVKLITDKMSWLSERQRVLAQNVANVDTPRYKPKDLAPFDFKSTLQQTMVTPTITQANHIATAHKMKPGINVVTAKSFETLPSGNAVNIEEEMMKVSSTGADFQEMINVLKRWQTMMRTAVGRQ
ncbi:MAG: flagellar basal body rod protein FlgB [Alphaproteobacteria bacterium]